MILKVLKTALALRLVQFENFQNLEYLLFTNCTRRLKTFFKSLRTKFLCDFLFIVHSTKLRRFHGNLIGTSTEYNLGLIVLLSTNQDCVILLSVL